MKIFNARKYLESLFDLNGDRNRTPTPGDRRTEVGADDGTLIDPSEYEERAAIMEFDGGLSRAEAEQKAFKETYRRYLENNVFRN